jgi:hypothetical protein
MVSARLQRHFCIGLIQLFLYSLWFVFVYRYEIFVHDFTESFPGQMFKGQGEAQVLLRLMCAKTCVWK